MSSNAQEAATAAAAAAATVPPCLPLSCQVEPAVNPPERRIHEHEGKTCLMQELPVVAVVVGRAREVPCETLQERRHGPGLRNSGMPPRRRAC
eukprot:235178-Chlamydomonas_euryale.AAC.2